MINGVGGAADVVVAVVAGVGVRRAASNANYLFRFADSAKHHVIWRHLRTTSYRNCLVRNAHLSVIRFWPVSDNMFDKQQQQQRQQSVVCTRSRSLIAPTVATWQSVSPQFAYKSDNMRLGIPIEIVLREFPLQKKCA